MSVSKGKSSSTKSQPGKSTKKGPGNVTKCVTKKTVGYSTIAAAGAIAAVIVISMVILIPRTTTLNVNVSVSQTFIVKTWNGTEYVTNSSFYPNQAGLFVIALEGKFVKFIDDEFASNSSAIITPSMFNETDGSGGFVEFTIPPFLVTPSNKSIVGKSFSVPFSSDEFLLIMIVVNINNDAVGDHSISGGLEWEFTFINAISHGLNKTVWDQTVPHLFKGSVDINAVGGYYRSSTINGVNATVNGVAMAFEHKYSISI